MKRFMFLLFLTGLLMSGCMKSEPATVATISPSFAMAATEALPMK